MHDQSISCASKSLYTLGDGVHGILYHHSHMGVWYHDPGSCSKFLDDLNGIPISACT
jgi:hypothetical protein